MIIFIPANIAKRIYRGEIGDSVLFVNQSGVDVFLDDNPELLEMVPAGVIPNAGTQLAKSAAPPAAGGEVLFSTKTGFIYARAIQATSIQQL